MSIINKVYPVTGVDGAYNNIFPSQKPINYTARRIDQTISSIVSGTNGRVRIATPSVITDIAIGDFVSWSTDAYSVRSSKVTNVVNSTTIEVEEVFVSTNVANSFINYLKNWFLEIRYVDKDTAFNDQNAIELFDFNSQVPSALDGTITANIGLPAEKLVPDFNIASGVNLGLFTEYQIQIRESFDGNRSGSWVGSEPNIPIMLVHGTDNIPANNYTDLTGTKKFINGYPLLYSYVYSNINDGGGNEVKFFVTQYDITQKVILSDNVLTVDNANGVYLIHVDTNTLNSDCAFIKFTSIVSTGVGQYDGDQYDPDQYQTVPLGVGVGFPYTFPLTLSEKNVK